MAKIPKQLEQGDIVWADIPDSNGFIKLRPAVVVTSTSGIADNPNEVIAAAITTTFGFPTPEIMIEIPWSPQRHSVTQLARRSAVVCNWLVELSAANIQEVKGFVPPAKMLEIVEKIGKLAR